jgi:hypothetical protein
MFLLMFAAILGGGATIILLWPLGEWIALLCAPLGGSVSALIAAVCIATQPDEDEESEEVASRAAGGEILTSRAEGASANRQPDP